MVSSTLIFLYSHRVDKNKHVMLSYAIIVASGTYLFTEVILVTVDGFQTICCKIIGCQWWPWRCFLQFNV